MKILLTKFGRISENEVVLPNHIAKDMMTLVFDNADNVDDLNILDVSSKQAEIAVATYNINPNKAKNVISLPSSPTSYEFTRKMYSVMGLPVENVISDYTTFDLIGDKHNDILKRLKDMKINTAVGNVPFQENFGIKGGNSSNAKSIYNLFIDFAIKLDPQYICMITPSRWMTKSAQGIPDSWVDKMLTQNKFKVIHDFENENDCFQGVVIKGGVSYFLWDKNYEGKCEYHFHQSQNNSVITRYDYLDSKSAGVVIRDPQTYTIIEKINTVNNNYFSDTNMNMSGLVSAKHFFDNSLLLTSNWTGYKDKKDDEYCIKYYVNINKERTYRWISLDQLPKHKETKDLHKVYIPGAGGKGSDDDLILGKPFYGEPNSVCSQTFLVIGYDAEKHNLSKEECQNIIKYIYTKFFRYLVSIKKKTQNGPRGVYQFAPLQNFTSNSDIDWSKSISDIDQQLYAKYDLTADEIALIESKIKPME
jgi:site-specific DNA-methyltransferase (adenine-specific)